MKFNFNLGTYFGFPLHINIFTIAAIILFYFITPPEILLEDGTKLQYMNLLSCGTFVVMLFFVVLHEYGHCYMARKLGWKVGDIGIYPYGCVARLGFRYTKPIEEILVVIAGPLVNIVFAVLFFIILVIDAYCGAQSVPFFVTITILFAINFLLAAFNFLPIFPMDGGRLLRASLSFFIDHKKATWISVKFGQVLAIGLICLAFYYEKIFMGLILCVVIFKSQEEITDSSIVESIQKIRRKTAIALNKPELETSNLDGLIVELESIKEEEIKQNLLVESILPLLKQFQAEGVLI